VKITVTYCLHRFLGDGDNCIEIVDTGSPGNIVKDVTGSPGNIVTDVTGSSGNIVRDKHRFTWEYCNR
jgi:hypothetical protein